MHRGEFVVGVGSSSGIRRRRQGSMMLLLLLLMLLFLDRLCRVRRQRSAQREQTRHGSIFPAEEARGSSSCLQQAAASTGHSRGRRERPLPPSFFKVLKGTEFFFFSTSLSLLFFPLSTPFAAANAVLPLSSLLSLKKEKELFFFSVSLSFPPTRARASTRLGQLS